MSVQISPHLFAHNAVECIGSSHIASNQFQWQSSLQQKWLLYNKVEMRYSCISGILVDIITESICCLLDMQQKLRNLVFVQLFGLSFEQLAIYL
jgi:hypothetical protein